MLLNIILIFFLFWISLINVRNYLPNINKLFFSRSYFRCTYRDDRNCAATKQVQQKDFTDPPVYEVTYKNSHSCTSTPMVETKLSIQSGSSMKRHDSISFDFSKSPVYSNQNFSVADSKLCQNQLNTNQHADFQFHNTSNEFTSVGYRTFNPYETGELYREPLSDYSPLQGLDELNGFDDFDLGEYMNTSDMKYD